MQVQISSRIEFKKPCLLVVLRYGLILSQKKGTSKTAVLQKPSVFGDDSDDEVGKLLDLLRAAGCKMLCLILVKRTRQHQKEESSLYKCHVTFDEDSVQIH